MQSDSIITQVKPGARILVITSNNAEAKALSDLMLSQEYEPVRADGMLTALEMLNPRRADFDLVILTLELAGGGNGWDILAHIKSDGKLRYLPVMILTSNKDRELSIKARDMGAEDVMGKPLDMELMLARIRGLLRVRRLYDDLVAERSNRQTAQRTLEMRRYLAQVMGNSPHVQQLAYVLENVVATDTTVLLEGESGTGKGMLAEVTHRYSTRSDGPFVVVNCSAYPETLLASELFGHEKGAFTGAIRRKAGRFEMAEGGTIFLDEIGDISPLTQLSLLRVIQDRQFERVGGEKTLDVNVRVLTATNKPLKQMVEQDRFREDLYYRLNVVRLEVPSLRDRIEDIPFLCQHFLQYHAEKVGKSIYGYSRHALSLMMEYKWPGNVRELRNVVEHAVLMCRGELVEVEHLPPRLVTEGLALDVPAPSGRLYDQEKDLVANTLSQVSWNKYKAAKLLGISRTTLYGKIKKFGLKPPEAA